jgi:hypothetical protein
MELPLLNILIGLAGLAVRLRLVRSARTFSALGNLIANALDRYGSQDGGMMVEVTGLDDSGHPGRAIWLLKASKGHGPYVPIGPAAALIERLVLSEHVTTGAANAAGWLVLDEIMPWYSGLSVNTQQSARTFQRSLFQRVLGDSFEQMPEVTRKLHRGWPAVIARGSATVEPATSPLGRVLAKMFRLPTAAREHQLAVVIESRDGHEHWTLRFGSHTMHSVMRVDGSLLEERFGLVAITMQLVATAKGLDMHPLRGRFNSIPLPRFLLPVVTARETSVAGRHCFKVEIALPIIGRLMAYRGSLNV